MTRIPEWLRSTLITFVIALAFAVSASDFVWTQDALIAVVIAAGRTALSAILPGGSFGVGSGGTEPDRDFPEDGGEGE